MAFDQRNIDAFRVLISGSGSYCTRGRFRVLFAYHNPDIPEEKHGAELRHRRTAERWQVDHFFALSSAKAEAANYPFCTIEPNTGIVPVPDPRLDRLVELFSRNAGSRRSSSSLT